MSRCLCCHVMEPENRAKLTHGDACAMAIAVMGSTGRERDLVLPTLCHDHLRLVASFTLAMEMRDRAGEEPSS